MLIRLKNKTELQGDKYEFVHDKNTGVASMYVKNVDKMDDGTYRCKVENGLKPATESCELCVELKLGLV